MDDLTQLLSRFSLHAGVFYTGNICGIHDFPADAVRGHNHLVRRGPVPVIGVASQVIDIQQSTLLFLPRPDLHRLVGDERMGAGGLHLRCRRGRPCAGLGHLRNILLSWVATLPLAEGIAWLVLKIF